VYLVGHFNNKVCSVLVLSLLYTCIPSGEAKNMEIIVVSELQLCYV